ncbi:hypothetical protein ACWC24_18745 [Streptomyces sp. NPDC001443]
MRGIPAPPFPRLRVGLIAVDPQLSLNLDPHLAVKQLRSAIRGPRAPQPGEGRYALVLNAIKEITGLEIPGGELVTSTLLSLPKLPHTLAQRTGLAWYGDRNHPLHGLIALNHQSKRATTDDRSAVDRKLVAAFLADLRAAYERQSHDRRCVVFLDDIDRPGGLAFLTHLTAARDADQGTPDPLLVIATASSTAGLPGPRDEESAELVIHRSEVATFRHWGSTIATPTSRHYYCIALGHLAEESVSELHPAAGAALPAAPPVIHGLTRGHGGGTVHLLEAAAAYRSAPQLRALIPRPGTPQAGDFLRDALKPLLRDFTDQQRTALVLCAAARNFDAACAAGLIVGDLGARIALAQKLEDCLWLVVPQPQDARARGGHGVGIHTEAHSASPVIHPWLRLLLLTELAGLPGPADPWENTHRTLRDRAGAQPVDQHYHSLALEDMDPAVDHLVDRLRDSTVPVGVWLRDLYAITAAPMREPVDTAVPAPQRALDLAHRCAPRNYANPGIWRDLAVLVACLWMASDPRNRLPARPIPPGSSPSAELNETIARKLGNLAESPLLVRSELINEARMYWH